MSTVEALEGSAEPKYEGQLDMGNFDTLVTLLTESEAISEIDVDTIVPSYAQAG